MPIQAKYIIDDQLREVLTNFPQITLAILFGSVASGKAHAHSDLGQTARKLVADKAALCQKLPYLLECQA